MAENKGGGQPVVQKTEGEENHDTNKKAIVDEETGEKEAEAKIRGISGKVAKIQVDYGIDLFSKGAKVKFQIWALLFTT